MLVNIVINRIGLGSSTLAAREPPGATRRRIRDWATRTQRKKGRSQSRALLARSPIRKNGHDQRRTLWERKVNATQPRRGSINFQSMPMLWNPPAPIRARRWNSDQTSGGVSSLATASDS